MYGGAVSYPFYSRLGKRLKEIRAKEEELLKRNVGWKNQDG